VANRNNRRWANKPPVVWRVRKDNQRQLPCHQSVKVRIKVLVPGIQSRWCDRCGVWRYFTLEPMPKFDGMLQLRWLTDKEAKAHEQEADKLVL
jgi:hypothetical protein